jgi:hypothetical protein
LFKRGYLVVLSYNGTFYTVTGVEPAGVDVVDPTGKISFLRVEIPYYVGGFNFKPAFSSGGLNFLA